MALIKGEGTHQILYGGADIFSGLRHNRGYLSRPDHTGSFPTVLLLHGVDGISSSVKSLARRLARHGLAVVGPDLYRGAFSRGAADQPWPSAARIASDLSDTRHWIASTDTPWMRSGPVGVLALDRAAGPALAFADDPEVADGLVLISPIFEGAPPNSRVPLLGFYGKDDETVPAAGRLAVQSALNHGEWVLYGDAGHGLIDESGADYRWKIGEDIADRSVDFFKSG